jgi:hypothetical protein
MRPARALTILTVIICVPRLTLAATPGEAMQWRA